MANKSRDQELNELEKSGFEAERAGLITLLNEYIKRNDTDAVQRIIIGAKRDYEQPGQSAFDKFRQPRKEKVVKYFSLTGELPSIYDVEPTPAREMTLDSLAVSPNAHSSPDAITGEETDVSKKYIIDAARKASQGEFAELLSSYGDKKSKGEDVIDWITEGLREPQQLSDAAMTQRRNQGLDVDPPENAEIRRDFTIKLAVLTKYMLDKKVTGHLSAQKVAHSASIGDLAKLLETFGANGFIDDIARGAAQQDSSHYRVGNKLRLISDYMLENKVFGPESLKTAAQVGVKQLLEAFGDKETLDGQSAIDFIAEGARYNEWSPSEALDHVVQYMLTRGVADVKSVTMAAGFAENEDLEKLLALFGDKSRNGVALIDGIIEGAKKDYWRPSVIASYIAGNGDFDKDRNPGLYELKPAFNAEAPRPPQGVKAKMKSAITRKKPRQGPGSGR